MGRNKQPKKYVRWLQIILYAIKALNEPNEPMGIGTISRYEQQIDFMQATLIVKSAG